MNDLNDLFSEAVRTALSEQLPDALRTTLLELFPAMIRRAMLPPFLSRQQASELTGLSVAKIANLCRSGAIVSMKPGRRVLIETKSLEAYLIDSRVEVFLAGQGLPEMATTGRP